MAGKKDLERLRRRKRRKQNIIRATVHFFVWAGVAVLYYVGFSLFFDTPVEYELKHSTDRLRREYAALTQRYDSLTTVMHNLSARDRNVFRTLFESDPYDFDSEYERRQAVTYENIFNRSSRRLKLELRERVADMEKRLDELNASYLDLQALIDSAGSGCNNIPAIQPTVVILFVMSVGQLASVGYEKIYLLQNDLNVNVSEVISTYVYKRGIENTNYSFSAAVGLFNNVINIVLLLCANAVSHRLSQTSLF